MSTDPELPFEPTPNKPVVTLRVGAAEVLSTGSLVTERQRPIFLRVANVTFKLVFKDEKADQAVSFEDVLETSATLVLNGFNNSFGTSLDYFRVADIGGKGVWMSLACWAVAEEARVLHYTLAWGDTVD